MNIKWCLVNKTSSSKKNNAYNEFWLPEAMLGIYHCFGVYSYQIQQLSKIIMKQHMHIFHDW